MSHQDITSKFSLLLKDLARRLLFPLMNAIAPSLLWNIQGSTNVTCCIDYAKTQSVHAFFFFYRLYDVILSRRWCPCCPSFSIYSQITLISYLLHSKLCVQKSLTGSRLPIFSLLERWRCSHGVKKGNSVSSTAHPVSWLKYKWGSL